MTDFPTPDHAVPAELRGVGKRYGSVRALIDVSLKAERGEVLAVLGPNGAGKTTLIHLLLGLARPDTGQAQLFGTDPRQPASRSRTGVMLQLSGVPATLKVREHIALFRAYYPQPLALGDILAEAQLTAQADRLYSQLSGGEKQRLHLALALCGDPDLLFLDEPTTGLDVASRRAVWEAVRARVARGCTVILTTHYLEEADALADRIALLAHGRIIAEGSPAEIKARTAGYRVRAVTALAPQWLRALPEVHGLRRDGTATELLVSRAEPVVLAMLQADPDLRGLEVSSAGLEDAFLALTSAAVAA